MIRAVIDVNLLVRSVLSPSGGSGRILVWLKQARFVPLTCREHLDELHRVLGYPRIVHRYHVTRRRRRRILAQVYARSAWVNLSGDLALCRDPNDDYLIELAILGQATHLVTEDRDTREDRAIIQLLAGENITVCGIGEFLQALGE